MFKTPQLVQACLIFLLLTATAFAIWNGIEGEQSLEFIRFGGSVSWLRLGIRIDRLSSLLFLMITALGFAIGRYSQQYLSGETRKDYFFRYLLATLASASLLVLSSNLSMFLILWFATSLSLHKLLVFYPHRPLAVAAAQKKFVVSRIGDVALLLGIGLTYRAFGTVEFRELFQLAESPTFVIGHEASLSTVGLLFALGAMTKSAQFPFHFWLPETMETPTPVSALMHAGIINAGGFLLIRLSPLLSHASAAHFLLAVVGAFSAVFGAIVMITQNDIKKKLAYSTISQMGMMIFCCGIGAFSLALFHLIAHSFYKAHAFLSTGMLVDESRKNDFAAFNFSKSLLIATCIVGISLILIGPKIVGAKYIAYLAYASVLLLGMVKHLRFSTGATLIKTSRFIARIISVFAVAVLGCVGIEYWLHHSLTDLTPVTWDSVAGVTAASITGYLIFFGGLWLSLIMSRPMSLTFRKLYVFFWSEGYFSQRTDWIVKRVRR